MTWGGWKSSFKKDREAIFFGTFLATLGKLADCSKPPSALCFELPIKSCHLTTVPPNPFILYNHFLDRSSPPIPLFWGLSLLQPCFRPSCFPCWWNRGISGAAYWWPVACCSGRRDSCIYTSKWQTDFFIKTLSAHRFWVHGGSWQASASLPLEPGPLRGASQSSRATRPSKIIISLFKTKS